MNFTAIATMVAVGILACPALASDASPEQQTRPAVDGVNGKLSVIGAIDGTDLYGATGAVTVPLGHRYGLQIDGVAAEFDGDLFGDVPVFSGAAHLFWRDPARGLVGVYARYSHLDIAGGLQVHVTAAEGAYYWDRLTIEGIAGVAGGDLETDFLSTAFAKYYPFDELALHIGHSYGLDHHAFLFGGEWGLPARGSATSAALFVNGHVGQTGTSGAIAGLRFYFGHRQKSLIRRHREEDPNTYDVHSELHLLYEMHNGCHTSSCKDLKHKAYMFYIGHIPP